MPKIIDADADAGDASSFSSNNHNNNNTTTTTRHTLLLFPTTTLGRYLPPTSLHFISTHFAYFPKLHNIPLLFNFDFFLAG